MFVRSADPILATLQEAVATESVNPDFPGGSRGEAGMVEFLAGFFRDLGIPFRTVEVLPGRSNIIAVLEGEDPRRELLFECHMDTVSVDGMTIPPFEPHIREGKLYGRGSCDTKSGGVAMLHAMKRIKESGKKPPCSIVYAGVIDEEYIMAGSQHLCREIHPVAAVVAEPTQLKIVRAHKGVARFRLTVTGAAAHSAQPEQGINAISKMSRLIVRIEETMSKRYAERQDPLLGPPTFNIGVIQGGAQVNLVPAECTIAVDRRIIPGETTDEAIAEFQQIVEEAAAADRELVYKFEDAYQTVAALQTPEDSPIVQLTAKAAAEVTGSAEIIGVPYATDGGWFSAFGVSTVVLGPGNIDQAHRAVEWVDCAQVLQAADIYQRIMENFR
ncbi:MAG: M20 family metallopeptidase [Bdellovibrionota bacterium]